MEKLNPTLDHTLARSEMAIDAGLRAFMLRGDTAALGSATSLGASSLHLDVVSPPFPAGLLRPTTLTPTTPHFFTRRSPDATAVVPQRQFLDDDR